jgi:hypothetical protein
MANHFSNAHRRERFSRMPIGPGHRGAGTNGKKPEDKRLSPMRGVTD